MKNILLISPKSKLGYGLWDFNSHPCIGKKSFMAPLHLATLSALTPGYIEVDIWDEKVHGLIEEETITKRYDLIGITGFLAHIKRVKEIALIFQKQGIPVVIGGPGVTAAPVLYRKYFDILLIGEGELIWPRFIADFCSGNYSKEYQETGHPDMGLSPPPRWDSIASLMKNSYYLGGVQTMRGCPFSCKFCNIWKLFGSRVRLKPIRQVLAEITTLERLGMERILFCVDNFSGNPGYAKKLLRELISLNKSFTKPLDFYTEISINIARDEEMLSLLSDANFVELLIGIESPNKESLKENNKVQNLTGDLVADCMKIISHGIAIDGSMIVGFDQDTPDIFHQHFEFFQEACIPMPRMHMLSAIPGTDLWDQLIKEKRILNLNKFNTIKGSHVDLLFISNIIPRNMTRIQLISNYIELLERIYNVDNFAARLLGFVSNVKKKNNPLRPIEYSNGVPRILNELMGLVDEKTQRVILDIVSHTHRHAPFMISTVISYIIRYHIGASNLPFWREAVMNQVKLEESGEIEFFLH